jgi:hypothetical protein
VALTLLRLGVFVLAQNISIQLHVGAEKILEPGLDPLSIFQNLFGDVIGVDVDAGAPTIPKSLLNRNRCALKLPRPNIELVIQLVLVEELAPLQV